MNEGPASRTKLIGKRGLENSKPIDGLVPLLACAPHADLLPALMPLALAVAA